MRQFSIAIETKDRRLNGGKNYLGETLRNLQRAGVFDSRLLASFRVVSGGEKEDFFKTEFLDVMHKEPVIEWVYTYPWNEHLGTNQVTRQQNAQRAIAEAAAYDKSDWVIKLEDDIDVIDDFLGNLDRWLDRYEMAPVPMFVLGATFQKVADAKFAPDETFLGPGKSFPRVRDAYNRGFRMIPHEVLGWYAAQALCWRRETAQQLADWLGPDPGFFDGTTLHKERGHDMLLQQWGQQYGRYFACTCPSFVQHIGEQSNLSEPERGHVQPFFQFPFPGRGWRYEHINGNRA